MLESTRVQRRRLGLAVLVIAYPAHFASSLWLPDLGFLSVLFWLAALCGGAVYCTETFARWRARPVR